MTVECKSCGECYERKYNVCPVCGTVRFVLPTWSKVAAAVAACYIILTIAMIPAGMFSFTGSVSDKSEAAATPVPMVTEEKTEATGEQLPPEATPAETKSPNMKVSSSIIIESGYDKYNGRGFTLKLSEKTVQLYARIVPPPTGDMEVIWKSSDDSVFTVDANGIVTAISKGSADLTVTYGSSSESIPVIIADDISKSADANVETGQTPQNPPPPSPAPDADTGRTGTVPPSSGEEDSNENHNHNQAD